MNKSKKSNNSWDSCWDGYKGSNFFGRLRINRIANIITKRLGKKLKFIDIGIGPGDLSIALKERNYIQFGVDTSKKSLEICKHRGLNVEYNDAFNLNIKDNTYDLSFSDGLLEHFPDKNDVRKLISEHIRVSKKYVMISLPSTYWTNTIYRLLRPYDVKEYRIPFKKFKSMLKEFKNVKIIQSSYYNFGLCYYVILEKIK